jgi:angiomotin like
LSRSVYHTGNPAYNLLNNTPSSSSIVSSTPTTPLIYNATNYENLMPSASSSKTVSATSNSSFDALLAGAYSGLYQPNYSPKLSSVPPASSSGISPNTSCSSTSTAMQQHQHQQPSIASSSSASNSNYLNYDQSLDEQRKTIDDQLKKLDNQLLTKVSELTLIQQHHIQLQQQQNRDLKTRNAALIHNSRASSLSLCGTSSPAAGIHRTSLNVSNNLKAQNSFSNSLQSLPISYDLSNVGDEEQEIFY